MARDVEVNGAALVIERSHMSEDLPTMQEKNGIFIDMAQQGNAQEHELGTLEAIRVYRKGVACAMIITLSIIMRMYDIGIITSFFALPAFKERYGYEVEGHGKQIPAQWQVALGIAALVGQVIGALAVAWPMEWFGRKKTLAGCLVLTGCLTFMQFFAPSIQVLTASEYLSGVVWGSYQVLIPTYSSEILPNVLRPYLAAWIAVNYNFGSIIIAGVSRGFSSVTTTWGFRIPFAIQWVWPSIILPMLFFIPESPWWLVRNDRLEEAERSLHRLSTPSPTLDISRTLAMMQKTSLYEQKVQEGSSVWDCLKGSSFRRTEIVIMAFVVQDFAQTFVSPAYFFEQIGLSTDQAFDFSIGMTAVSTVCCMSTFFILRFLGRRSAFIFGISLCCILQNLIGFLDIAPNYLINDAYSWGQVGLLIAITAVYNLTIGPLTYAILTEVPSIRLRSKTVGIAIAIDALCGIIIGVVTPYLINPGEANARGKSDFIYGGISIFSIIWCYFRLPETKHRTVEELDYMFEQNVNTREFRKYHMDEEILKHDLQE